jgi:hypothetical protein
MSRMSQFEVGKSSEGTRNSKDGTQNFKLVWDLYGLFSNVHDVCTYLHERFFYVTVPLFRQYTKSYRQSVAFTHSPWTSAKTNTIDKIINNNDGPFVRYRSCHY